MSVISQELRRTAHAMLLLKRHWMGELRAVELDEIVPMLGDDAFVIDVGAHCGSWTVALSAHVKRGQVFAVEALPYYADLLEDFIRLLGRSNVKVFGCAATETEGEVRLAWKDNAGRRLTGFTHIAGEGEVVDEPVAVRGCRLEHLVPVKDWKRTRLIKLDIEGAELSALRGAAGIITAARPVIYTEINEVYCNRYGHSAGDVFAFLEAMGYGAWSLGKHGIREHVSADTFSMNGDVLFLPIM